ncbi:metal dependent phosphohydrolase [Candidatus Vecturithrix granuli]|uniref:Metal dependent phosphohydrolase n=1 Tax=Vecturithrix granuli TaxID=1499967 RepID=A0A081BXP7_VECG1|nr:metal dependent phosphohydrolase [Candidatus Vecturithrix granuli]
MNARFEQQLEFLVEIDKVKQIFRRTLLMDQSRTENDAEHSWHLAVMAIILGEYAATPSLDIARVVKMVLIHDVVEIDAGDTYLYDEQAALDKDEREQKAAERIFALLPGDQAQEFRALWEEFEQRDTPEAKFAAALDRFQPLFHNYKTQGASWKQHGIRCEQVLQRGQQMQAGSPFLWEYAQTLIERSVESGYLAP